MKSIFALFSILILFTFGIIGQTKTPTVNIKRINSYLSSMEKAGFSGSVLVAINGKLSISRGFGYRDAEKKIKNSPETMFDIGSITKQFTAAAILKLETQRKLSTTDKITKYFSDVPDDKANITLHDLLRHQSGLISNVGPDYEKISEAEFLQKVFGSQLRAETGTRFSYSNIGYSLLAMVIEKVSGRSYESYLYDELWKPARMESTGYSRQKPVSDVVAIGYAADGNAWGRPTEKEWDKDAPFWHLKGNGGILSTTEDMYKWHQILGTEMVLSGAAKRKFYHPELRPEETEDAYYAYGWDVSRTVRGTTRIWHNGTNRIFYSDFIRFVDDDVTIITLSNKSHQHFHSIALEISRLAFNPTYRPEIPALDNQTNRTFTERIIKTLEEHGLEKAKAEYKKKARSEHLLEFMMRDLGFDRIDNNKPDSAILLFEMNVFAYPASAKALQGLGEGYMETGNNNLAIKYLKKSLAINADNSFVKDLIKRLEQ